MEQPLPGSVLEPPGRALTRGLCLLILALLLAALAYTAWAALSYGGRVSV